MSPKKTPEDDHSTEEKIKNAAREVFHNKGYAATRTRDIAEAAGINLALLNYYFRSKEKLFDIIMMEAMQSFMLSMSSTFNDPDTTLHEKLNLVVNKYIDHLTKEPQIPLFILSEMRNNPEGLAEKFKAKTAIMGSVMMQQYLEGVEKGEVRQLNFYHFMMNLIGLTVFPFSARPLLQVVASLDEKQFMELMEERRKLIPGWIACTLKPEK